MRFIWACFGAPLVFFLVWLGNLFDAGNQNNQQDDPPPAYEQIFAS